MGLKGQHLHDKLKTLAEEIGDTLEQLNGNSGTDDIWKEVAKMTEPVNQAVRLAKERAVSVPKEIGAITFPVENGYMFKEGFNPDTIVGHWAEDMSPYEIKVPAQLRNVILFILNNAGSLK